MILSRILIFALALSWIISPGYAITDEPCSRSARINYQDVLVDTSSTRKGEGIKFYLEKDPIARTYYKKYEKNQCPPLKTFCGRYNNLVYQNSI